MCIIIVMRLNKKFFTHFDSDFVRIDWFLLHKTWSRSISHQDWVNAQQLKAVNQVCDQWYKIISVQCLLDRETPSPECPATIRIATKERLD